MNYDEVVDLPAPHARVAARRARLKEEVKKDFAAPTTASTAGNSSPTTVAAATPGSPTGTALDLGSVPLARPAIPRASAVIRSDSADDESAARIVMAIDYGTTFTGVAYAQSVGRPIDLNDIHVVQNWPGASEVKVPSQISYSNSKNRLLQYGYSIDDDSEVLSKTKLELQESRDRGRELTTFTQTLHGLASLRLNDANAIAGRIPRHLAKTAEDIVQDYLERIADVTYDDMINTLGRAVPEQIPIDLVITHPAKWSEEALNKTYRAAISSFGDRFPTIRNVSFVSEPEACAHYTLRAAQKMDHARFRKGDCFIVVDAGGGTVDLASFQITDIDFAKNKFMMKPVGHISGFACGSTYVDEGFIKTLKRRLDPADSEKIVGTGMYGDGGHFVWTKDGMEVFKAFLPVKHGFTGTNTNLAEAVPLPRGMNIQDRADRGIHDGNLELTADDIREMFSFSVDKTLALIGAQISSLDNATPRRKVKSIFLSGGFARSEYLFSRVADFAGQQGINVEKGLDCWCAVSKGAVMKGLGLLTEKPTNITRSPCYYGVKTRQLYSGWRNTGDNFEIDSLGVKWATDQVKWFVRKDDAIQPGKDRVTTYNCHWLLRPSDFALATSSFSFSSRKRNSAAHSSSAAETKVYRDIVFVASHESDAPRRFKELNMDEAKIVILHCNMNKVPASNQVEYGDKNDRYMKYSVQVEVRVSTTEAKVTVTSGGVVVAGPETLPLKTDLKKL
ncbi:hypothetical protein HMPREF1624_05850 [Sporothrix schenckii ATCC 58251]|uniref:Hsp70-like protein n=1 Tax=Sporothrix schenckii (strain ATCC 58251 / de Perez 2211183) TaxID=1391915 RepID=U7PSE8_SPOS1|nr:hypothetical protein HMPREF1624_05850 [Sporothrix schenckii ATCC 58251]